MKKMNDTVRSLLLWVVIVAVVMLVFSNLGPENAGAQQKVSYSKFIQQVTSNQVSQVKIDGRTITGKTTGGQAFKTILPWKDPFLTDSLLKHQVEIEATPPEKHGLLMTIFISWFPILLLVGLWFFFMRQMGGGGKGGAFSFGKSKAKLMGEDQVNVTLNDVAGIDESKEEVSEIVDFLKNPNKYSEIGGQIPRGVLMIGPPGTGKTLLGRAIAGEAKVPFFSISGSDFVEMFVGVGASRVRDMFEQAKKRAPCIIFIDEIDAVGRHRGSGMGGGHDEREQTLNQLLVEMDGFAKNEGVIVIAATNRPDVLDPALLRPGRFDRQVHIPLPDFKGREAILRVHMKKVASDDDVRPDLLARGTPGFSGADLANLVNEAALLAARSGKTKVTMNHFESAKDKILMGTERRTMAMTDEEKKLTAYHESGHAIVGRLMPEHDPVYKVTIIPRGRALGVTMHLPERDHVSYSKRKLISQLCSLYGGRIAEALIFGEDRITTGASNDIQRATEIGRNMVTKWGLSDKLGPLRYGEDDNSPMMGGQMPGRGSQDYSDQTAADIDQEVRRILDASYSKAEQLLKDNVDVLHAMAEALVKYETLDAHQVAELMQRQPVTPPSDQVSSGSNTGSGPDGSSTVQGQVSEPKSEQDSGNDSNMGKDSPSGS